jgi:hypothetical protein
MDRGDLTARGFRSSFRDWAAECTNFPAEVAEMALAHTRHSFFWVRFSMDFPGNHVVNY